MIEIDDPHLPLFVTVLNQRPFA